MQNQSGATSLPQSEAVVEHRIDFGKTKEGRYFARCSCGWGFNADGLLACQLKASIHDL
jgi:hypothetical protein